METVLVVDDDRLLRETLLEFVSDCGYRALGRLADRMLFSSFSSHTIQLVVSDVDMPDMSGFELLARLQQANFGGPIIHASAADEDMKQAAQRAGSTLPVPPNLSPWQLSAAR